MEIGDGGDDPSVDRTNAKRNEGANAEARNGRTRSNSSGHTQPDRSLAHPGPVHRAVPSASARVSIADLKARYLDSRKLSLMRAW